MEKQLINATYRKDVGRCLLGGVPLIFHCHHYNTYLQRTIHEDAQDIDTRPFLVGAAAEAARSQLKALFAEHNLNTIEARKRLAETVYRWQGFGTWNLDPLRDTGGHISTAHSHYDLGWAEKFGRARGPISFFSAGWLVGAAEAIFDLPDGSLNVEQTACIAAGAAENVFILSQEKPQHAHFQDVGLGTLRSPALIAEPATGVPRAAITDAILGMPLESDARGLVPAFGVYLTRHFANYYCRISFELVRALEAAFGDAGRQAAEPLLVEAGRVCAFNTFGGIMLSAEWDALILPNLKTKEDWAYSMLSIVNAFGWGIWQVQSIGADGARFVLHNDYESVAWEAMYGKAKNPISYLAQGGVEGLMHLLYAGDITQRPILNTAFYNSIFNNAKFAATFEASLASGDSATVLRVDRIG